MSEKASCFPRPPRGPYNGPVRLRARFARRGEGAALSHLEQIRFLRRMALASGLPCLTAGGSMPKMSFGPAVSVGYESEAEYADLYLASPVPEAAAAEQLGAACAGGFALLGVKKVPVHFPSLESLINAARYRVCGEFGAEAQERLSQYLARKEIMIVKRRQEGPDQHIDARPLIASMTLEGGALEMLLRFGPGRNLKPERIVFDWLGLEPPAPHSGPGPDPRGAAQALGGLSVLRQQLYWENSDGTFSVP